MVSVARYSIVLAATLLVACQTPVPTPPAFSKHDPTTRWWSYESQNSRKHYIHEVRDLRGQLKAVYRYYRDEHGKPVLDGESYFCEHEEFIVEYRDGREVRRSKVVVSGVND